MMSIARAGYDGLGLNIAHTDSIAPGGALLADIGEWEVDQSQILDRSPGVCTT